MNQCTRLVCKEAFSFKVNGKGRTITFKVGDKFWVTSTLIHLQNNNTINIARMNQKFGYEFTEDQVKKFFEVLS